jgi:hypothetical protein
MNSRRLIVAPEAQDRGIVPAQTSAGEAPANVRLGSKADVRGAKSYVRFGPNSDRESGFPHKVMSALPPKADMCGATRDVRFGSKAGLMQHSKKDSYSTV